MIQLRPISTADAPLLQQLYADAKQTQFIQGAATLDPSHLLSRMLKVTQQPQPRYTYWVAIDPLTQQPFGLLSATAIDWHSSQAELGIMLLPQQQARGVAKQAFLLWMDTLRAMGIHHFYSQMHPDNHAAKRLVRQCGMTPCAAINTAHPGFYWVELKRVIP